MNIRHFSLILGLALAILPACAQDSIKSFKPLEQKTWHYSAGVYYQLGGTSPIPLPASIRKIKSFKPGFGWAVEGLVHRHLKGRWDIAAGLRLEQKTMKTKAETKAYHMEITEDDGGHLEGLWTGPVQTQVKNLYLTIPVLAEYTTKNYRWTFNFGPYISFLLKGGFKGYVEDGYIRTPDETGENVEVTHATYDFADDERTVLFGLQGGATYHINRNLAVNANLAWGLNSIFPSDFKTLTFKLYPIYGQLGLSYNF